MPRLRKCTKLFFNHYLKELCSSVTLSFIYSVYKQLVNLSTRKFVTQKNFVHLLLCLLFTLSTSNWLTCPLVNLLLKRTLFICYFVFDTSNLLTCPPINLLLKRTLFICYFVFYLLCLQATC